jgi:hypothetical protein
MTFGAKPPVLPVMFVFGASEVFCDQNNDTTGCVWWILARKLGVSDQHFGQPGWPVTINTFGGTHYPTDNLPDCAKDPGGICAAWANYDHATVPKFGIFIPGGNDAAQGTLIGSNYTTAGYFSAMPSPCLPAPWPISV